MKQILCFSVIVLLLGGSVGTPISLINTVKAVAQPCSNFQKGSSTQATIIIKKHVINDNGGTKTASDFTPHLLGSSVDVTIPGNESGCYIVVDPGQYTITEAATPSGYTGTISTNCGGTAQLGLPFNLNANTIVTCTITNDDNAPKLTLNKIVINDNGGTQPESAWTLTANGGAAGTLTGFGTAGSTDVVSGSTFQPGTYSLSESGPAGYTASLYSCVKNNGAPVLQNSITLVQGDIATCTITNNDISPTLKVIKKIINDDGRSLTLAGVTLKIDGGNVTNGTANNVNAGTRTVSEIAIPGYTSTIGGDCAADGTVSLALGNSKVCTITNNDAVIECPLPLPNPWTITTRCTLTSDATAPGDVIVQSGAVLTISPNRLLDINFALHHLLVQSGGGVLIKAGGKIF